MRQEEHTQEQGAASRGNGSNTPSTGTATGWSSKYSSDAEGMGTSVKQRLTQAKDRIADKVIAAQDRSTEMMSSASGYIQRWPFRAVAIAAGVGLAAGWLLASRGSTSPMQSVWPRRSLW